MVPFPNNPSELVSNILSGEEDMGFWILSCKYLQSEHMEEMEHAFQEAIKQRRSIFMDDTTDKDDYGVMDIVSCISLAMELKDLRDKTKKGQFESDREDELIDLLSFGDIRDKNVYYVPADQWHMVVSVYGEALEHARSLTDDDCLDMFEWMETLVI